MTAYELADFIDGNDCEYIEYSKVATMLRQQADQLADQQTTINFLEVECAALREQLK